MMAESAAATLMPSRDNVRLEREADCAVIVIDNPPVNVSSHAVRLGLMKAIEQVAADDSLRAAVLIGAGRSFVSGSDLKEFSRSMGEPQMPTVLAAVTACRKPVIAALHGMAMGGGFEIALACDARIAASDLVVALPEVKLGIMPGAGGTQRVPRLAGISRAIDFITTGRRVPAQEALELGLIDEIAAGDLRSFAVRYALDRGVKRDLSAIAVPPEPAERIDEAVSAALRRGHNRPFIARAVEAVRWAAETELGEGLVREREVFQALRVAEEAFALRHLFFAERAAGRIPALEGVASVPLDVVAVIGAGTMGSGIATALVEAGYPTILVERDEGALGRGMDRIRAVQDRALANGRIDRVMLERRMGLLTPATDFGAVAAADLAIEAVFETMEAKRVVLAGLDQALKPGAIIASNTSYLDLDALAAVTTRPERVLGLHFFNPANVMRLLEVVKGAKTSPEALATGFAFGRKLGKVPVLAGVCEGFIGNRIYNAYRNQCEFMLEDGALPQDIDTALEAFGLAMGPFRVGDLSGLDIAWNTRRRQAAVRDPGTRYVPILDRLCERGRFGQKAGAGWYSYPNGSRMGVPDDEVAILIAAASAETGIVRRSFTAEEIVDRALGAMINEACLLIGEGIARTPADVDLVLVHGYGFPDYRGGPLFWASRRDRAQIVAVIDRVEAATGFGFRRADISKVLDGPDYAY